MVTSGPKLLRMAMSGSMVLPHLGSVLMSLAHVTTGAQANHVLDHVLKYKDFTRLALALTDPGRAALPTGELALFFTGPGIMDPDDPGMRMLILP